MSMDFTKLHGLLPSPIAVNQPLTALAPMQDVTDLAFMTILGEFGSPDYFFTEYFRVYANSRPEKHILKSITENKTGRPVFAQLIGESIPDLVRIAQELSDYPIAGIDLNMGCPAPRVYRKNVGGGLLREPEKVEQIFAHLRTSIQGLFTVKMRIGFENTDTFPQILNLINDYGIDLLSLHGRTVKERYHSEVHYDYIAKAVQFVNCPVLANGNITSAATADRILRQTGAAGLMIGRSAIRNPWIFKQIREHFAGQPVSQITLADVYAYIKRLTEAINADDMRERSYINCMKKYLNFIGLSVDKEGAFLNEIRRVQTKVDFFTVCDRHLLSNPTAEFAIEPYSHLIARPSCETPTCDRVS